VSGRGYRLGLQAYAVPAEQPQQAAGALLVGVRLSKSFDVTGTQQRPQ
jgi:hypothetical protein